MSRQTWMQMVRVVKQKQQAKTAPRSDRKPRPTLLEPRSVREDHYELLFSAGY